MDIVYSDSNLSLCVKPVGILSEDEGMPRLLKESTGKAHFCVHRLDRAVGGLMVYAKDSKTAGKLSCIISNRQMTKEYLAVISGCPEEASGTMRDLLFKDSGKNKSYVVSRMRKGVKEAQLEYSVIGQKDNLSLVRIRLCTGRSHQIRVQFSSRGLPLLGDVKYGSTVKSCPIALWSSRLEFPHPANEKTLDFTISPPDEYPWNLFNIKGV